MGKVSSTLVVGLDDNASSGLLRLGRNLRGFNDGVSRLGGGGMLLGLGAGMVSVGAGAIALKRAFTGAIGGEP